MSWFLVSTSYHSFPLNTKTFLFYFFSRESEKHTIISVHRGWSPHLFRSSRATRIMRFPSTPNSVHMITVYQTPLPSAINKTLSVFPSPTSREKITTYKEKSRPHLVHGFYVHPFSAAPLPSFSTDKILRSPSHTCHPTAPIILPHHVSP